MNTSLFLLRAIDLGLTLDDLERLEFGTVLDLIIEKGNDSCEYRIKATQKDFDAF